MTKLWEILSEGGSIPKPSRNDLYDAIEMAQESYPEELENVESLLNEQKTHRLVLWDECDSF